MTVTRLARIEDAADLAALERANRDHLAAHCVHEIRVHVPEPAWAELARRHSERARGHAGVATDAVVSPMQGTVLQVEVAEGDEVEAGAVICVVEAMKMENPIVAHRSGVVTRLGVTRGEQVKSGQLICIVSPR